MKRVNSVDIYNGAHYESTIEFKNKFAAWLFHMLINRSLSHNGSRQY